MDSSVSETCCEQEGAAYNGHFGCTCYHPLKIPLVLVVAVVGTLSFAQTNLISRVEINQ